MAWARAPSPLSPGSGRVRMDGLVAGVRALDPASRALLDLSLRRRLRDDDMAPLLRIDAFNLAWRRARALERLASALGLADPAGLAQVRAALPYVPEDAWCVPLGLGPGPARPPELEPPELEPTVIEGEAETMEFDAIDLERDAPSAPEHAWGPRALAVRPVTPAPAPQVYSAPPALPPRLRDAVAVARHAVEARPSAARGALLAGAGALLGALLSRRRR
jgi:hypothetical protein